MSFADGSGIGTGSGIMNGEPDYMATPPPTRYVELGPEEDSNADGKGKALLAKINWKAIGIGTAVGVIAIIAIKKFGK